VGFLCVLALGLLPAVGCNEDGGEGGSGGTAGTGGMGGTGGTEPACQGTFCACTEAGIRAAIAAGGGPFTFDCDGPTTVVTEAEIVIDNDVILDGEGNLTVDGDEGHRVFSVDQEVTAELRGFGVTNGASDGGGGGIWNDGTLTLTNSTVSGNTAGSGGGIWNDYGTLTLTNSTVSGNSATSGECPGYGCPGGGGILNYFGTLTLTNSTVTGNSGLLGGGIYNLLGGADLTNSTVSGNTAADSGGGIHNWGGAVTLTSSTVSGNTADNAGGGIYNGGTLTLTNTVVDNDCAGAGSGSGGGNLESPEDTCGLDQETDQVNVSTDDLKLGPLADNGGPTMTHALGAGSVAIDAIPEEVCVDADGEPLTTDQRGEPRPAGSGCDVGAFEVQP
jgi:hypothetical protein